MHAIFQYIDVYQNLNQETIETVIGACKHLRFFHFEGAYPTRTLNLETITTILNSNHEGEEPPTSDDDPRILTLGIGWPHQVLGESAEEAEEKCCWLRIIT